MFTSRTKRRGLAASGLLSLAVMAGCSQTPIAPNSDSPSLRPELSLAPLLPGQTFWDFVTLNGGPAFLGPDQFYSPSRTLCNGTLGCVALSTNKVGDRVVFKWHSDNVQPGDEKGVGPCMPDGAVCDGDEVGNVPDGAWLLLDLNGLAPGVSVTSVRIASLQNGESYKLDLCTTATTGCGAELTGSGTATDAIWDVAVTQGSSKWIRFKTNLGDYIVQGITTKLETATTGNMGCSMGYWKQSQHFKSWKSPYVPTGLTATKFNAAFGIGTNWFANSVTLLDALGTGGGGSNALGRQAAAALLNAAQGFYPLTTAQVIKRVQDTYNGLFGVETTKDYLENYNANLTCPLN